LICADTEGDPATKNAKIIWKLDMIGELKVFPHHKATCSPLIVGDLVYVVTGNGVAEDCVTIPSPNAPSFLAVDKKTGAVKWQDNSPGNRILESQWSSPVAAEIDGVTQVVFPGGDGWLYAFEAKKGDLLWKFDCNPKAANRGDRNQFMATPVIHENKLYIGVGQNPEHIKGVGHLWCIDIAKKPKNKDKDLSPVNDNFDPKADVNKDSGLVWHYGGYINPKPATGRDYKFGRTLSTCAVHDGLLYTADFDGHFYCFDATTGKLNYEHDMKAEAWCSPYWVDGHVYMGNENGEVLVFKHGAKKEIVNTIDFTGNETFAAPRVRATPVACNGVLYVNTEGPCRLWAISPGGK
jgi:outer membrane protein assembly factor BamB